MFTDCFAVFVDFQFRKKISHSNIHHFGFNFSFNFHTVLNRINLNLDRFNSKFRGLVCNKLRNSFYFIFSMRFAIRLPYLPNTPFSTFLSLICMQDISFKLLVSYSFETTNDKIDKNLQYAVRKLRKKVVKLFNSVPILLHKFHA